MSEDPTKSDTTTLQQQQRFTQAIQNDEVKESLRLIEDLKFFLATAPANWQENQVIRRYYLSADEGFVSCIFWNNLYFITGTDIVRCIVYKFQQFGRKIIDRKKFEEGIFSDLRNLKCGTDAILEPPKSAFLEFLYRNSCLRTQKKQKVFFWFNVPHDKLMADALERDLKKEKMGQKPTTIAEREPALSFKYEEEKMLYSQLVDYNKRNMVEDSTDDNIDSTMSTTQTMDDFKESKGKFKRESEEVGGEDGETVEPKKILSSGEGNPDSKRRKISLTLDDKDRSPPPFEFLTKETPDQYKQQSDDEDDFPLDYFQETSNDYIVIDSSTNYANFPSFVDNPDFEGPTVPFPYPVSNQVVVNDEYLIEQTLPIKTPMPLPRSGRFDELHQLAPLSSKLSSFPLPPYSNQYPNQFPTQFASYPQFSYPPPSAGLPPSATYPMHLQALPPLASSHPPQQGQSQSGQPPSATTGPGVTASSASTTETVSSEADRVTGSASRGQSSSDQTSASESTPAAGQQSQPPTSTGATSLPGIVAQQVPPPSAQQLHFFPHQYHGQDPYTVHDQDHWAYAEQFSHSPYLVVPDQEAMYYGGHMYPYPPPQSGYLPPPQAGQTSSGATQAGSQPGTRPGNTTNTNTATSQPQGTQPQHLYIPAASGGPMPSPAYGHFSHYSPLPNSPYALSSFPNRQNLGGPMMKRPLIKPLNKINKVKAKKDD